MNLRRESIKGSLEWGLAFKDYFFALLHHERYNGVGLGALTNTAVDLADIQFQIYTAPTPVAIEVPQDEDPEMGEPSGG